MALLAVLATLCASAAPLTVVSQVDLPRFMGPWYVIACIPTRIERNAWGAIESYRLAPGGRVLTEFSFHEGAFDGPLKRYRPTGFPVAGSHGAIWGMQFIWPFKADYRVMYLDADYTVTVIGREKRDFVWIMARAPTIAADDYARLLEFLQRQGYEVGRLRRVPQRLPS